MELNYQIINQEKNQVKELLVTEVNQVLESTFGSSNIEELTEVVLTDDQKEEYGKKVTALNKSFEALEKSRKDLKKENEKPYKSFEEIYKTVVEKPIKDVKNHFKTQVDRMNEEELNTKIKNLEEYLEYLTKDSDLDGITLAKLKVEVKRSDSDNKLKDYLDKEIDRIKNDIAVLQTMKNSKLLLHYYYESFNLADAIKKVDEFVKNSNLADATPVVEEETLEEEVLEVVEEDLTEEEYTLKVVGTKGQMKALSEFLKENHINFDIVG